MYTYICYYTLPFLLYFSLSLLKVEEEEHFCLWAVCIPLCQGCCPLSCSYGVLLSASNWGTVRGWGIVQHDCYRSKTLDDIHAGDRKQDLMEWSERIPFRTQLFRSWWFIITGCGDHGGFCGWHLPSSVWAGASGATHTLVIRSCVKPTLKDLGTSWHRR